MNCLSKTTIQQYIDNECSVSEKTTIETHLSQCDTCKLGYNRQLEQSRIVINNLSTLSTNNIIIPPFVKPVKTKQRKFKKTIIYSLTAACILLFVLIFVDKIKPNTQNQLFISSNGEYDSNKPITEQALMISIVDPAGNRSEFYLQ